MEGTKYKGGTGGQRMGRQRAKHEGKRGEDKRRDKAAIIFFAGNRSIC